MSAPGIQRATELAPEADGAKPKRSGSWRIVLFVAAIAAALALVYLTPLRGYLSDPEQISSRLRELGPAAPAVFVVAVAVLVTVGVPRLLLCAVGGMTFGIGQGLLWSEVGTLIGCYGTFLFARWSGPTFLLRRYPALSKYETAVSGRGLWAVVLARQIPVTGLFVNLALGLTRVRHRDYLLGTALGTLPESVPVTLAGAGAVQGSPGRITLYLTLALVAAGATALLLRRIVRRKREVSLADP